MKQKKADEDSFLFCFLFFWKLFSSKEKYRC